jgi:hypothetical protein
MRLTKTRRMQQALDWLPACALAWPAACMVVCLVGCISISAYTNACKSVPWARPTRDEMDSRISRVSPKQPPYELGMQHFRTVRGDFAGSAPAASFAKFVISCLHASRVWLGGWVSLSKTRFSSCSSQKKSCVWLISYYGQASLRFWLDGRGAWILSVY